jgi:serine/threonine protein kinase
VLKEFSVSNEKDLHRIKQEVKALQRLQHPLIAEIEDLFVDESYHRFYLQLKYCAGGSLPEWRASKRNLHVCACVLCVCVCVCAHVRVSECVRVCLSAHELACQTTRTRLLML